MDWSGEAITRNESELESQQKVPWLFSKAGVLIMLFLVLGPFGLVFLYKSPCFSRRAKGGLTIVVLVYTAIIILALVAAIFFISRLVEQLL